MSKRLDKLKTKKFTRSDISTKKCVDYDTIMKELEQEDKKFLEEELELLKISDRFSLEELKYLL